MKVLHRSRSLLGAAVVLASLVPRAARADDARARAQALFDEAMTLMDAHAYDRACPELEDVLKLQPGKIGTLMELGRCYEGSGKLASAWGWYHAAADAAARANPPDRREAKARAKLEELAPRMAKLVVAVAAADQAVQGFAVRLDGHAIGPGEWGTASPADPGKHDLVASAPGKNTWTDSVVVPPGPGTVTMTVPVLDDAPGPPASDAPRPAASGPARLWPQVSGALGVASLVVAIGFGIDGLVARNALDGQCNGTLDPCMVPTKTTAMQVDALNGQKDRGLAMFIGFGLAGAAGVTAGIVGLVRRKKAAEPVAVVPAIGPGFGGVVLEGRF